ncbi:MAG: hypothetical protein A2147_09500 [Chloroflexi bacterium RBG_16_57_8]|nr:MAG: hypothetical protein A2147_09500 [Chloroflexi bacterium RBG_16_57_8]
MKNGRLALLLVLIALVALTGGRAVGQNTVTLFDDGDYTYSGYYDEELQTNVSYPTYVGDDANNLQYDLGGAGRPADAATAGGHTYSGHEYLTVWGDTLRATCTSSSRLSAFVRNDVGLDHSSDWYVSIDVANDLVVPDWIFRFFLLNFKPDATTLNRSDLGGDNVTFAFYDGDQHGWDRDDPPRFGFELGFVRTDGVYEAASLPPRLDPDPDHTDLRGGHNYVTVQWTAATQTYDWTISNINGARRFSKPASELKLNPTTAYFAAGTPINGAWSGYTMFEGMASGWTIFDISYGQGRVSTVPNRKRCRR